MMVVVNGTMMVVVNQWCYDGSGQWCYDGSQGGVVMMEIHKDTLHQLAFPVLPIPSCSLHHVQFNLPTSMYY